MWLSPAIPEPCRYRMCASLASKKNSQDNARRHGQSRRTNYTPIDHQYPSWQDTHLRFTVIGGNFSVPPHIARHNSRPPQDFICATEYVQNLGILELPTEPSPMQIPLLYTASDNAVYDRIVWIWLGRFQREAKYLPHRLRIKCGTVDSARPLWTVEGCTE